MSFRIFIVFCRSCEFTAYHEVLVKCAKCGSNQLLFSPVVYKLRSPTRQRASKRRISEQNSTKEVCRRKLFPIEETIGEKFD